MTCPVCAAIGVREVSIPPGRPFMRCAHCRLLFDTGPSVVDPTRTRMTDEERRLEERVAQRRAPHFTRVLRTADAPGRLLDVGTGVGELLKLAREAGWEAVGVDVDPAVVAYARARGLDVRLGRLPALLLPAASFDLVTLWNIIDFVPDPLAVLTECRRLLAPGGRIFVRTPNAPFQRAGARLTRTVSALGLARSVEERPTWVGVFNASNFSARTLRIALERTGFQGIDVRNSRPVGGDPYLGHGRVGERVLGVGKRAVFAAVQAAALVSGGRCLLGPSIEAWARKPA